METPYGRGHDAPLRSLDQTDDASLRGLIAMRRAHGLRVGLASLAVGILGQCVLHRYDGIIEHHPLLGLGLLYGFPIGFMLLAFAWGTFRYKQACRRAGLSAEAVANLRAHLAKVPPLLPPMPAGEMLALVRALESARRGAAHQSTGRP
ncbi:MAG: hypothetical protein JWM10_3598 [Myxococcaceae bacterium]|nr:hypothetical protein [Myxococcaceae bacterium]